MSTIKSSLGTLAAVASLATPAVDAAVQASPISNQPLNNLITSIDIDGNGTDDFEINADIQQISVVDILSLGSVFNAGELTPLTGGEAINGGLSFGDPAGFAEFLGNGTQYAGFGFQRDGNNHFAWLEFNFPDSTFTNGSIVGGAWETIADTTISAGGAIPEPRDAALAGGILAGIVAFIRHKLRRSKD
ncbi:hypothetical protein [Rubellicoccus peritrichatus]|uniref:PEP-CTERM sorting domain-containing protein n=1 Tax=Rubellicoccus peritrichatus TaxID=3080537 RepID=A0AAQ3LDS9_9BACT|nr:hypothetical protein [Puniceicoccus sp. CR14]WOO41713.1 hypothetical protein RZN69_01335 [Puniceicoccus sp. CR14]